MAINPVNPMGNLNSGNAHVESSREPKEKTSIIKDTVSLGERSFKNIASKLKVLSPSNCDYGNVVFWTGTGVVIGELVGGIIGGPVGAIAGGIVGGVVGAPFGVHEGIKHRGEYPR